MASVHKDDQDDAVLKESIKLFHDTLKHLTTLSSGSILVTLAVFTKLES